MSNHQRINISLKGIVLILIFSSTLTRAIVTIESFFPFGPSNGDYLLRPSDDGFVDVRLQQRFPFFNVSHEKLFVNVNGAISFHRGIPEYTPTCGPLDGPTIAPFWADIDTRYTGSIYYRESTNFTHLEKARIDISKGFPNFREIKLLSLFIATYEKVHFFGADAIRCNETILKNTFQSILTTDGVHSFVLFYYNNITWTTGTSSGGNCTGQGGTPAKAGFDLGDGTTFYEVPLSCTPEIQEIETRSNMNEPGKWGFRIDNEFQSSINKAELILYNNRLPTISTYVAVTNIGSDNQLCLPQDIKATRVCLNAGIWIFYTDTNYLSTRANATIMFTGSEGPQICANLPPLLDKSLGSYRPAGDPLGSPCSLNLYIGTYYSATEILTNTSMNAVPHAFNSVIRTGSCEWQFYMKEGFEGFSECLRGTELFVPDFTARFGVLAGDIKSIAQSCNKPYSKLNPNHVFKGY